jgi:hypothetical protein
LRLVPPGLEDRLLGIPISSTPPPFPDQHPYWVGENCVGAAPATPWGRLVYAGGMQHRYIVGTLFYLFNICGTERNLFNRAPASKELI